ncbi:unnamed protein product [Arctogadus glacialis]
MWSEPLMGVVRAPGGSGQSPWWVWSELFVGVVRDPGPLVGVVRAPGGVLRAPGGGSSTTWANHRPPSPAPRWCDGAVDGVPITGLNFPPSDGVMGLLTHFPADELG